MKFLILAHRWDTSAAAVAALLQRRHGAAEVRLVALEELLYAPSWAHRLEDQRVTTEVRLHDGTVICSDDTGVVLQRLRPFTMPHFDSQDRAYAAAEMSALLLSWLAGFACPVLNPVAPRSFCFGRSPVRWLALASEAGLPLPRLRLTSNLRRFSADGLASADASLTPMQLLLAGRSPAFLAEPSGHQTHSVRSVLLAGKHVVGDLPSELLPACRAFTARAVTPVLRINFSVDDKHSRWTFVDADALPMLNAVETLAVVDLMESLVDERITAVVIP